MNNSRESEGAAARRDKTLIRAFTFLGGILGLGIFGLLRTVLLFLATLGWMREGVGVGPFYYWLAGGVAAGLALGWGLVRARGKL
jgi:hypothetical protein